MTIVLTLILFTSGLIITAALTDFLSLKIPNILSGLIIGCFITAYIVNHIMDLGIFMSLMAHVIPSLIVLVIMAVLFFMRLFGGGDAKIIPAISLWIGYEGLAVFLMLTSLAGGVLAMISIILRKTGTGQMILRSLSKRIKRSDGWVAAMKDDKNVVPYGIAIAIGGIGAFRSVGYLP